jgi:LPXTG-motif cell wall-anchored protein
LKNYDNKAGNTVTVTDVTDGTKLLDETFPAEFQKTFPLDSHSKEIKLHLSVKSADGQGAIENDATSPVCPGQESSAPAPSESAPAPATSSPAAESPAPSADTSSSAAAVLPTSQPSPAGDDLAETGSSSSTPMIAGGAAVVLVAGAGILWASRKRRATQH